jgi:hypothetical protein
MESNLIEQWTPVAGYEGLYDVSTFGRVRSYYKPFGRGSLTPTPVIKKQTVCKVGKGYYVLTLAKDGKKTTHLVHRLVAGAFLPNPENKPHVNHKDGEHTLDNKIDNLEWATVKENADHAWENGLTNNRGSNNGMSRLDEAGICEIHTLLKTGMNQREVAEKVGVSRPLVSMISTGKRWKHVAAA